MMRWNQGKVALEQRAVLPAEHDLEVPPAASSQP